jgi:hypothetical protein
MHVDKNKRLIQEEFFYYTSIYYYPGWITKMLISGKLLSRYLRYSLAVITHQYLSKLSWKMVIFINWTSERVESGLFLSQMIIT